MISKIRILYQNQESIVISFVDQKNKQNLPTKRLTWQNAFGFHRNSYIYIQNLLIMLPDVLFNELDGAAFSHACEFCSNLACNQKKEKTNAWENYE